MRYGQRLFTGIVGLLLVALVIVTPGYIVSKTHDLENAGKDVLSFSEVVEGAEAGELTYTPYSEFNETTAVPITLSSWVFSSGVWLSYSDISTEYDGDVTYNYDGYRDCVPGERTRGGTYSFYAFYFMKFDAVDMLAKGINTFYFDFETIEYWKVNYIKVMTFVDQDWDNQVEVFDIDLPENLTTSHPGRTIHFFYFSGDDLNTMATGQSGVEEDERVIMIRFFISLPWTAGVLQHSDFQLGPDYYEVSSGGSESSTTGNTTHYVPVEYKIGQYELRKASLLVGGILIGITALCSTTFINPSNILKGKKRLIK